MKKYFTLIAIALFAFTSCQKENTVDEPEQPSTEVSSIPTTITCEIDQEATKTQYSGNSTFGWTQNDRVCMPVTRDSDNKINYYSFITSSESGSTTATFNRANASDDMEGYTPGSGQTSLGFIIYPINIFTPSSSWSDEGVWNSGSFPVVNLPGEYPYNPSTPLNSAMNATGSWLNVGAAIPLIGRKVGSKYKFATAVGILKFTVSNIPANMTSIKLVSTTNCIAGKLAISNSSTNYQGTEVPIAQIATSTTGHNNGGTREITLITSALTAGDTYEFYYPIPVGSYDANTLSLKIETKDGETVKVISKKIAKNITIARNEILSLPELSLTTPSYSISVSNSGTSSPQLEYINTYASGTARYLRFCVRSSSVHDLSEYDNGQRYTDVPTNKTYGLINATNVTDGYSISVSGNYYFHYVIITTNYDLSSISPELSSLDDNRIVEYGTIPFVYTQTLSDIIGTYSGPNIRNYSVSTTLSNCSITLAALDEGDTDAPEGTNIKILSIGGVSGKAYGTYDGISAITFAIGQIYNTFDEIEYNSVKYDRNTFMAFENNTWYAPSFSITRKATLKSAKKYLVLRYTNENLWSSDHTEGIPYVTSGENIDNIKFYGGGMWCGYYQSGQYWYDLPFVLNK